MSTSRTSTTLTSQRTQQKSQEHPRPFNKRPAKGYNVQATPAKVRKLSHSDTATQTVSVEIPAKTLASALKRRQESIALGSKSSNLVAQSKLMNRALEATPGAVVLVPTKTVPAKVRFVGQEQEPIQGSRRSSKEPQQGNIQTLGDTVQVVVPIPTLKDGSGDKRSPQRKVEIVAEDDETPIATMQTKRPRKELSNPDADFETRYREVKSLGWTWVKNHFSDITPEAKKSLNLLHLAHTSPELMEYANWISCCGQKRTWEDVFNEQRAQLVYGLLGKMLEVHVFGQEMFGADQEQLRELRELDMELASRDGTSFLLLALHRRRFKTHILARLLPSKMPRPQNPRLHPLPQRTTAKLPPLPRQPPRLLHRTTFPPPPQIPTTRTATSTPRHPPQSGLAVALYAP